MHIFHSYTNKLGVWERNQLSASGALLSEDDHHESNDLVKAKLFFTTHYNWN